MLLRLLASAVLAASLAAAAPAAAEEPPLRAKLVACETADVRAERRATFVASMPADPRAVRLQVRFTLLQRLGADGAFKPVPVPGWDRWQTAGPGRPGYVVRKVVQALAAPAAYRASVRFRWLDASGDVVRAERRTTRACEQPAPAR